MKDNFGFWDSIQLNEKQEASLKKVYDESFSGKEIDLTKSEYQQDEPLAAEAKRILDDIALVGWTSGGHSGGYVPRIRYRSRRPTIPRPHRQYRNSGKNSRSCWLSQQLIESKIVRQTFQVFLSEFLIQG